jgi:hypothetical protein
MRGKRKDSEYNCAIEFMKFFIDDCISGPLSDKYRTPVFDCEAVEIMKFFLLVDDCVAGPLSHKYPSPAYQQPSGYGASGYSQDYNQPGSFAQPGPYR